MEKQLGSKEAIEAELVEKITSIEQSEATSSEEEEVAIEERVK